MNRFHDLGLSPPPPAYSEQEFDQKISLASQLSLNTYQDQVEREDMWEVWDDAQFEAAAARLQNLSLQGQSGMHEGQGAGPSSNRSSMNGAKTRIQPLQIHKKNPSAGSSSIPAGKLKPSWLVEEEADAHGASSSRTLPPLAAPAYTPSASSEPSSAALTPSSALTNPYGDSQWGPISPVPTLPDPHADEDENQPESHSDVPPALNDESLPPPPFSPDNFEGHLLDPRSADASTPPSPALSATLISGTPSHRGFSPAYSPNPDTNLTLADPTATVQHTQRIQIPSPQPSVAPYPNVLQPLRHSIPPSLQSTPVLNRPQRSKPNQNTVFPSQTHAPPQINVDLSMIYEKRPAVPAVQETRQPQDFNAAAFYNSAVSAHLGSTYSKPVSNSIEPKRQSHQPAPSATLYTFPQAAQSMPGRYRNYPQANNRAYNTYNTRSYNPSLQDPLIRSPTPTYPAGTANPMPQMLAAANEGYYNQPQPVSYSAGRGQVTWTEPFNSYR